MTIKVFSAEYLDELTRQALVTPRRRQHRNIHVDYSDPCQRLFNAIEPDSYLRPHRHGPLQGAETMIAVRGLMALVFFDERGDIEQVHVFGAWPHGAKLGVAAGVETPPGKWHTVISLASGSILLEVKAGPFDPDAPRFPAPWAPAEGTPEGQAFLHTLVASIGKLFPSCG